LPRLCLVVSTAPEAGELDRVLQLAEQALTMDVEVAIFFMADSVAGLPPMRNRTKRLIDGGAELAVCAKSASERGLSAVDIGFELGGQDDHAAMVSRADRLLAFT